MTAKNLLIKEDLSNFILLSTYNNFDITSSLIYILEYVNVISKLASI